MLLAIESSCDETAAALFSTSEYFENKIPLSRALLAHNLSSQIVLHQEYGGVVPELAAREHVRNLSVLVPQIMKESGVESSRISVVAASCGPGLKGCLLVGLSFAKGVALSREVPFFPVNHLEGHLLSVLLNEDIDCSEENLFPALFLLVSGGHTQLVFCTLENGMLEYKLLSTTQDDAAGEAFDKIGTLLGLPYPAGAQISRLAKSGRRGEYSLPTCAPNTPEYFSFSGLKTAASRLIENNRADFFNNGIVNNQQAVADFALAVEEAIVNALEIKVRAAISEMTSRGLKINSVILSGGVAANESLRTALNNASNEASIRFLVPEPAFCTDNAAMIGAAALFRIKRAGGPSVLSKDYFQSGAQPRFPLESLKEFYAK